MRSPLYKNNKIWILHLTINLEDKEKADSLMDLSTKSLEDIKYKELNPNRYSNLFNKFKDYQHLQDY